jgi:hypothetical protein
MKTKLAFFVLIITAIGVLPAMADSITISLDNPNQTGQAGETLGFFGTVTNTGGVTIFLNDVNLDLSGTSFSSDFQDMFFANVPASLDPGDSSGDILLFDVTLSNPLNDPPGLYGGTYTLLGGADGGDYSAQDILAQANLTIDTAVPEPSSVVLLFSGLLLLAGVRYRRQSV